MAIGNGLQRLRSITPATAWRMVRLRRAPPVQTPWIGYDPHDDGQGDPGEIVWTWVAFEDDPSHGKDRPVLLIGRQDAALLGLYLTSKDHDRDATQEARAGRRWMDVGSGSWDRRRRPSEVRLDRLLVIDPTRIRREGSTMDRSVFDSVIAAARSLHTG